MATMALFLIKFLATSGTEVGVTWWVHTDGTLNQTLSKSDKCEQIGFVKLIMAVV